MPARNLETRKRITFLFFFIFFVFVCLAFRLSWLQLVQGTWYQQKARENRLREIAVEPKRGAIYDRNGHELAVCISVESVYAVPAEVRRSRKVAWVASEVARILDMEEKEVYELITRRQHSVWLKLKITPEQSRALREARLPGIGIIPKFQRYYPKNNLACHVLGIVGAYNQGLEGLEVTYNRELSGVSGRLLVEYDASGQEIPGSVRRYIEPRPGLSLVLTIDQNLQYIAERELDKVFQERHPKSASIIVMDPRNGEILALANRPDFNPNKYQDYPASARRNVAISNSYEPGSTFKIVTLASALEEGLVDEDTRFYDPGYIKVGDRAIQCWLPGGHGSETLAEVVQNSCNPGFISMGLRLGVAKLYKYIKSFGFGPPLGIDLPGEAGGIFMPEKEVKPVDLAVMSMGQGNAVTPLQLICAMCVEANGGRLIKPHVVKQIRDAEGHVVRKIEPEVIRQVITPETARKCRSYLERVVSSGTGRTAYLDSYAVGGKTGTAQKPLPGGGYDPVNHVASFLGFGPVDNPRLAVLIMVDSPQGYPYYGGTVCGPVFKEVMRDSLRYLNVPVRYQDGQLKGDLVVVPPVLNLSVTEAERVIREAGLQPLREGKGNLVCGQLPLDGAQVKKGSKVLLRLERSGEGLAGIRVVPDLRGKNRRAVADLLGLMNLVLEPQGESRENGVAQSQDPSPGTRVPVGSRIRVMFILPPREPGP